MGRGGPCTWMLEGLFSSSSISSSLGSGSRGSSSLSRELSTSKGVKHNSHASFSSFLLMNVQLRHLISHKNSKIFFYFFLVDVVLLGPPISPSRSMPAAAAAASSCFLNNKRLRERKKQRGNVLNLVHSALGCGSERCFLDGLLGFCLFLALFVVVLLLALLLLVSTALLQPNNQTTKSKSISSHSDERVHINAGNSGGGVLTTGTRRLARRARASLGLLH